MANRAIFKSDEEALDTVFDALDDLLLDGDFNTCSWFLKHITVSQIPVVQMINVLSATHLAKDKIDEWSMFYERVRVAMIDKGEDPDELLKGFNNDAF